MTLDYVNSRAVHANTPVCAVTLNMIQLNIQLYSPVGTNMHAELIHGF